MLKKAIRPFRASVNLVPDGLKEEGNNYCVDPAKLGSDSKRYHKTSASDCIDVDQHCHAVVIKIDPDDPSIMYLTTWSNIGGGQFQSLKIPTAVNLRLIREYKCFQFWIRVRSSSV